MNHARLRRSAASLAAAAVALGGLVAINAASSSAAVPNSGDRIAHWGVVSNQQVKYDDILAPEGQRFVEAFPDGTTSTVVALTNQHRVVVSGDAYPQLPAGLLDGPVRDLSSSDAGNSVAAVLSSGAVVAWSRSGLRDVNPGLCAADQVALDESNIVVVCEDGTLEVSAGLSGSTILEGDDAFADVQQVAVASTIATVLNGDGTVVRWNLVDNTTSDVAEAAGQDIAVVGNQHAITTSGGLISYDFAGRNIHSLPADEGGVDPAVLAEGVVSIASSTGAAFLTTAEGSYAAWGTSTAPRFVASRALPAELEGKRFTNVNAKNTHVTLIVADTDPPTGSELVTP